jgi:hypothetical protein
MNDGPMHPLCLSIPLSVFTVATPSSATRCDGDFNTFVASTSAKAAAASSGLS